MQSLEGRLTCIRFHKASKFTGNMFLIATLDNGTVVKGELARPAIGESYRFWGEFKAQKGNWGDAFEFHSCEPLCDGSAGGMTDYLVSHVDGIGRVKAKALVDRFGAETLTVLRTEPAKALEVAGITEAIVGAIQAHFDDARALDPVAYSKLVELFGPYRIGKRIIERLVRTFGSSAPERILSNPYMLLDLPRIGWKTVDAFALTTAGYSREGRERHRAAVVECLQRIANDGGHTCATGTEILDAADQLLGCHLDRSILDELIADGTIAETRDDYGPIYQLGEYAEAEETIAKKLAVLMAAGRPLPDGVIADEWMAETGLGDDQARAAKLIEENAVVILAGPPGTGKAQPLDAKILTPTGWTTMGEIKVGDLVVGSDGRSHAVTGVFPQGDKEVFRVTFDDDAVAECCEDHLWSVWKRDDRYVGRPRVTLSLRDIILDREEMSRGKASLHYFPMVSPVEFEATPLPLDPYALGLLLGDGSMANGLPRFTSVDIEIYATLASLLPEETRLVSCGNGKDYRITGDGPQNAENPLTKILRSLGIWGCRSFDKFIPDIYKFATIADRVALLNGLLDTDGFADKAAVEYLTTSRRLACDVQFIVESLGGKARIRAKIPTYIHNGERKEGRPCYRMSLVLPEGIAPFRLGRKAVKHQPRKERHPVRTIALIEPIGIKPAQCISVDSPDHLYVTDRCVLTHNTYLTSHILKAIQRQGIQGIRGCAPTGKASKRLAELLGKAGVFGIPCTTIHKALAPSPNVQGDKVAKEDAKFGRGREEFSFGKDEAHPFDESVIVVDETSMVDVRLMAHLLRAVKPGTRVIFVGDWNQLPSVGPGSVLRDIRGLVPTAELTEIRRSDGGGTVVKACHAIKDGRIPQDAEAINLPTDNWIHLEMGDGDAIAEKIVELHATTRRFDPMWEMQVVSAQKAKYAFGCDNLNRLLSAQLNPEAHDFPGAAEGKDEEGGPPFRIGDKIVRTKNGLAEELVACRDLEVESEAFDDSNRPDFRWNGVGYKAREIPLVNGDMGQVLDILMDKKPSIIVRFRDPDRLVRLPFAECHIIPAYAMTVHKCQGSGFDYVIVPVHKDFYPGLFTRELFYTAISRAQILLITVGQWSAIEAAVGRKTIHKRKTTLCRRLIEALEAAPQLTHIPTTIDNDSWDTSSSTPSPDAGPGPAEKLMEAMAASG